MRALSVSFSRIIITQPSLPCREKNTKAHRPDILHSFVIHSFSSVQAREVLIFTIYWFSAVKTIRVATHAATGQMKGSVAVFVRQTEVDTGVCQQHLWNIRKGQYGSTRTHARTPSHQHSICLPRALSLLFSAAIMSGVQPDWSAASTGASWDSSSWTQST